jgi:hypothetical protein
MRHHPLTPMTDATLVCASARQIPLSAGWMPLDVGSRESVERRQQVSRS